MNPTIAGDGDIEVTRAQHRNYLLGGKRGKRKRRKREKGSA